ncbi:MAG: Pyrimidine 5'-nucleotidase YjjG [Firmicutes bacterium ADurb.Bin506]|jgi:putative hydrolase of the HAD superfamily|nr:MAG: Pyrimidine 5'-nucleotidase YjjG [Firmicutes bacterium ADurb.Bin506]
MQNPFRRGVFPHIARVLAPYVIDADEPEKVVYSRVVGEARRRLFEGKSVEAYDWDDIVAQVATELYGLPGRTRAVGPCAPALGEPPHLPPSLDVGMLVRHYCAQPGMVWSLPGAHEALRALKDRGHILVVVSNGYHKYQIPVMEALGIARYFSDIYTPEQVGAAKPASGIFHAAWRHEPEPIHVGDDIIHDGYGARAAGGYSVWLYRNTPEEIRTRTGAGVLPEQRPSADWFPAVRDRAYAATWAVESYGVAADDCVPDALIWDLEELPALVDRLEEERSRGGSRRALYAAQHL